MHTVSSWQEHWNIRLHHMFLLPLWILQWSRPVPLRRGVDCGGGGVGPQRTQWSCNRRSGEGEEGEEGEEREERREKKEKRESQETSKLDRTG